MLALLAGGWRFVRAIDNGVSVTGEARLTPAEGGALAYREDGRMRLPGGAELDAHADYRLRLEDGALCFEFPGPPPRRFQRFALVRSPDGALAGESRHLCAPDAYLSRIAFAADGSWSLVHDVAGPRKRYRSDTRYHRG